jgi:hypothetical protein
MDTNISEEFTTSVFRVTPENEGSMFLKEVSIHMLHNIGSQT